MTLKKSGEGQHKKEYIQRSHGSDWLERPTDNRKVSSSNLDGTIQISNRAQTQEFLDKEFRSAINLRPIFEKQDQGKISKFNRLESCNSEYGYSDEGFMPYSYTNIFMLYLLSRTR
jgi:hypothetical protein